jgi:hypothetical protein
MKPTSARDYFDSKFFNRDDAEEAIVYTVSGTTEEDVAGAGAMKRDIRLCLSFEETAKLFPLNIKNGRAMMAMHGEMLSDWQGKEVEVFFDADVEYGGKKTGGLRLRKPTGNAPKATPARKRKLGDLSDLDNDLPRF